MPEIKAFSKYLFDETGDKLTFKHNLDVSGDLVIGGNVELSGSNKVVSDVSSSAITAGSVEAGSAVVSGDVAVAGLTSTKYLELNNNVGYMSKSFGDVVYDSGANKKGIRVIMNTEALTPVDVSGTLTGGDVGMFAIRLTLHSPEYGNLEVELFGHLDERASSGYRDLGYRVVSLADSGITIETAKYYITQGIDAATVPFSNDADILQNKSYFFFQLSHASNTQFDYNTVTVVNVTPVDGERTQLPIADYIDIDLYTDASWNSISTIPNAADVFASGDIPEKPLVIPNVDIVENLYVGGAVDVSGNLTVDGVIKAETLQVNDIHHVTTTASDGDMDLSGNLHVSDDISANGAGKIGGDLIVGGDVSANVNLRIGGDVTANSNVGVGGDLTVGGTIDATISRATQNSITTMTGLTSVGTDGVETVFAGDVGVDGSLNVAGNIILQDGTNDVDMYMGENKAFSFHIKPNGFHIYNNSLNRTNDDWALKANHGRGTGGILQGSWSLAPGSNLTVPVSSEVLGTATNAKSYVSGGNLSTDIGNLQTNVTTLTSKTANLTTSNFSGNATSATRLQNARTIGGVAFNGTANIDLPGVNTTGNQGIDTTEDIHGGSTMSLLNKQYRLYSDSSYLYLYTNGPNNNQSTDWRLALGSGSATTKDLIMKGNVNLYLGDFTIQNNKKLISYRVDTGYIYPQNGLSTGTVNVGSNLSVAGPICHLSNQQFAWSHVNNYLYLYTNGAANHNQSSWRIAVQEGENSDTTTNGVLKGNWLVEGNMDVNGSITAERISDNTYIGDSLGNYYYDSSTTSNTMYFKSGTSSKIAYTSLGGRLYGTWQSASNLFMDDNEVHTWSYNNENGYWTTFIRQTGGTSAHPSGYFCFAYSNPSTSEKANRRDSNPTGNIRAQIYYGRDSSTANTMNFTGQHHNYSPSETVDETYTGFIVSSSGVYRNKFESGNTRSKSSITVNESLPIVVLSGKDKDKKCFGVISDKDDCGDCVEHAHGNFVSVFQVKNEDRKLTINSLGEGALWVCDVNGAIENGDYITTSVIPGIGMKQDDDLLHNYTVAKITMDCDFAPQLVHQNKLKLDASGNPTLDEATQEFEFEMAYDESGNPVMEEEYEMKYVKINTSNYVVYNDAALTEEFLRYDHDFAVAQPALVGQVFKMAFVGCTYHCG